MNHLQKYELAKQAFDWNNPSDDFIPFNEPPASQQARQAQDVRYSPSGASANPLNANPNDPYNDWIPFNEPSAQDERIIGMNEGQRREQEWGQSQDGQQYQKMQQAQATPNRQQRQQLFGRGGYAQYGKALDKNGVPQHPYGHEEQPQHPQPQTSNYRQTPAQLQQQQQQPTNTWKPKPLPTSRVAPPSTNSGSRVSLGPDGNSYNHGLGGSKAPALAPTVTPKLAPPSTP